MADVAGTELTSAEREFLRHPALGAIILFRRNYQSPEQLAELVRDIRAQRDPAPLIAVDQEGGRVQRFREGFTTLPPLFTLGRLHDSDPERALALAHDAGRLMAAELRRAGVDFSFAPVLDLSDPDSRVIGDRAFHADAAVITALAGRYIDGMASAGMRATGKHFPGHGGVVEDSHHELPIDPRPLEALWESDMLPYRTLHDRLGGVMTAHVLFPAVDEELPTYSRRWIGDLLRDRIGFRGIVFSDDLVMAGAAGAGDPPARARRALAAGCDMVLVCNDQDAASAVADDLLATGAGPCAGAAVMAGGHCGVDTGEYARLDAALAELA